MKRKNIRTTVGKDCGFSVGNIKVCSNKNSEKDWLTGERAVAKLREYESKTLDEYHRSLQLWSSDPASQCYAVLAAFDSLVVALAFAGRTSINPSTIQLSQTWQDGLLQSVRWLAQRSKDLGIAPTRSESVIKSAGQFLRHAGDYANVADYHVSFNRGLVDVSVDPDRFIVRFSYAEQYGGVDASSAFLEDCHVVERAISGFMQSTEAGDSFLRARRVFSRVSHILDSGRIVLRNISELSHADVLNFVREQALQDTTSLPNQADLGGFLLNDYRAFWSALARLSLCALYLFSKNVLSGMSQSECMPTQVVYVSEFDEHICELSGLSPNIVSRIRQRVTIDPAAAKPDVLLTPLINDGNRLAWSPRFVVEAKHIRNLLKSMARSGNYKARADALIELDESPLLHDLASVLKKNGYQYQLRTKVGSLEEEGEIDLLAWTGKSPDEILLVEAKSVLEPDEVNEMNHVTDAFLGGQEQLRKCIRILKRMPPDQKKRLFKFVPWDLIQRWYSFVYTRHTMPNNRYDHSEIPGTQLSVINVRLRPRDRRSPRRLVSALRERKWMDEFRARRSTTHYSKVRIGDITYELPGPSRAEE